MDCMRVVTGWHKQVCPGVLVQRCALEAVRVRHGSTKKRAVRDLYFETIYIQDLLPPPRAQSSTGASLYKGARHKHPYKSILRSQYRKRRSYIPLPHGLAPFFVTVFLVLFLRQIICDWFQVDVWIHSLDQYLDSVHLIIRFRFRYLRHSEWHEPH